MPGLTFTDEDFSAPATATAPTPGGLTFSEDDFSTPTTFASNLPIIPATPQDIAETAQMGSPAANIAKGFGFMGRAAVGGLADIGKVAMRPITDELFPEQAAPGPIGPPENIQALMANEPLPAKNLATLPKGLQFAGHAAQGLIETAPKIGGVAAMQAAGVPAPIAAGMVFGATEQGFDPVQGAIAAALPLAGRVSGGIAGKVAKVLGVDSPTAINWIKGIAGTAGPAAAMVAQGEHEIAKLPADQQDAARVQMWEGVAGQAALGPMGVKFEKTLIPRAKAAAEGAKTPTEAQTPAQPPTAAQPTPATALHPEVQTLLDKVTSRTDHQVEVGKPDGSWKPGQMARPNRAKGTIEINPDQMNKFIMEDTRPETRAFALGTILAHEDIHLRTAPEDATAYTGTLTALEKGIERKLYGDPKISDTNLGFEAIRRRMEQLSKMDTSETVSLVGKERWKLKSLEALNSTVRGIRESMGTKASKEGLAILDRVTGNIEAGIIALGGTVPEPAATRQAEEEPLKPDMESARRVLTMSPDEFQKTAKSFNNFNLELGKNATPENIAELKQLKAQANERLSEAMKKASESRSVEDLDNMGKLSTMPQFFNEAIIEAQKNLATPTAKELLDRPAEGYNTDFFKKIKYDRSQTVRIAAGLDDADFPKLQAERDSLLAEATKLKEQKSPDFAKRAQLLLKAQTLREIIEANDMLKGQHAGEDMPGALRRKEWVDPYPGEDKQYYEELLGGTWVVDALGKDGYYIGDKFFDSRQKAVAYIRDVREKSKKSFDESSGEQSFPGARRQKKDEKQGEMTLGQTAGKGFLSQPEKEKSAVEGLAKREAASYQPVTGTAVDALAKSHVTTSERPSFRGFSERAKMTFGPGIQPGQLREHFGQAMRDRLMTASGKELGDMVRAMGLRRQLKLESPSGEVRRLVDASPDAPKGLQMDLLESGQKRMPPTKVPGLNERYRVIGALYEKLMTEAGEGAKSSSRKSVTPEDVRYGQSDKQRESSWNPLTSEDVSDPVTLARVLTADSRPSAKAIQTETKRVTVLQNRETGKVEMVSTYLIPARAGEPARAMILDPASGQTKAHAPLESILKRYRPIYSVLLDEPVQKFRQSFKDLGEFENKFASEARQRSSGSAEPADYGAGGELTPSPSGGKMGVPGLYQKSPGALESGGKLTDAEAGSFLDTLQDEVSKLESPEDTRLLIDGLESRSNAGKLEPRDWQTIAALEKVYNEVRKKNPQLTELQAYDKTLDELFDLAHKAQDREDFQAKALGRYARQDETLVRPLAPAPAEAATGGRELTLPRFARKGVPAEPMVPRQTPKLSEPGAMRNLKQNLADEAAEATAAFTTMVNRHDVATDVARSMESVENTSNNLSHQAEMDVRLRSIQKPPGVLAQKLTGWQRGNREILSAANVLIESSFDKNKLPDYQKLLDDAKAIGEREVASGRWTERKRGEARLREVKNLQDSLTYAEAHWNDPDLQKTAQRAAVNYQEIYQRENLAGYDLTKDPNYLPHRYVSGLRLGEKTFVMGKRFREPKSFDSLFEAIANPDDLYISATHDAASLVGHRTRQSLNMINKDAWLESLKAMDAPNGQKLALAPKLGAHGLVSPDANYRLVEVRPGKTLAIHQEFADGIQNLTAPDWVEGWGPTRGLLHASQMIKHSLLIGDFFHLSRMGYYGASILGKKFGWKGGWTVLDIQAKNIPEAIKRGVITEKQAQWGRELIPYGNQQVSRRWLVEKFYKEMGSNLGKVQDALYKDLITDMTAASPNWRRGLARVADPTVGRYNRFLFDKLTRGLMAESVAREFEKQSKAKPEANPEALMRDISRDVNNFYGNIGKQGWFKSAGMRSFMRLFMLAPQWVEGLAKKEAIGYSRLTGASSLMGKRQGLTALGTTGSAVGKGMLFMAGLTQAINLITRGHPTWMNKEKEHKLDAYIPSWGGSKEGFWLSPLAIFNEITHDLWRLGWSKGTLAEAAAQIAGNKESPILRAAIIMGTGKTPQGEQTTSSMERVGEAWKSLVPMPITFGRFAQAGAHAVAPGLVPATQPGALQRQFAGIGGVKIEPDITQAGKMSRLAKDFMQQEGLQKDSGWIEVQTTSPSYSKLRQALRNGDESKAHRLLDSLRKQHNDSEILKAMKIDAKRPFTGSLKNEKRFLGSLDQKGMDAYFQATDAKLSDYEKFIDWYLRQPQP